MSGRISWWDTRMTWPSLQAKIQFAPWHWAFLPRWYFDFEGIGWCVSVEWLFLDLQVAGNDKPFELVRSES